MKEKAAFDDETGTLGELEVKTEVVERSRVPVKPSCSSSYPRGEKCTVARVLVPHSDDGKRWPKHKLRELRAKRLGFYEIEMNEKE